MAKKRRKSKNRNQKEEAEASKRFMYILLGLLALFVVGFAVLRLAF